MNISIDMPSGPLAVEMPTCIGHYYIIESGGERFLTACIDESEGRPKRMRQAECDTRYSRVFQPHQYTVIEKDPLWQD